jgi:hypothetical protein
VQLPEQAKVQEIFSFFAYFFTLSFFANRKEIRFFVSLSFSY